LPETRQGPPRGNIIATWCESLFRIERRCRGRVITTSAGPSPHTRAPTHTNKVRRSHAAMIYRRKS